MPLLSTDLQGISVVVNQLSDIVVSTVREVVQVLPRHQAHGVLVDTLGTLKALQLLFPEAASYWLKAFRTGLFLLTRPDPNIPKVCDVDGTVRSWLRMMGNSRSSVA